LEIYKVVRRWYTVQIIEAGSEEDAIIKAQGEVLTAEEFYEEDFEVGLATE